MSRSNGEVPWIAVSDRYTRFTSVLWKSLCDIMEIKMRMTYTFHPQANGAAERTNQTLKQVLRTIVLTKM